MFFACKNGYIEVDNESLKRHHFRHDIIMLCIINSFDYIRLII